MRVATFLVVTLTSVALVAVGACSQSSSSGANPGQDGGGTIDCADAGQVYAANMSVPSAMGKYNFTLVQAMPAPPGLDTNVWTMKIADATGASPPMSALSAKPYMPLMNHGTGQVPQFAANPDGSIAVSNINLFMAGLWTVTFTVAAPASDGGAAASLDTAVFTFCVGD